MPNNPSCESVVIAVGTDLPPISFEQLEEAVCFISQRNDLYRRKECNIFKIEESWDVDPATSLLMLFHSVVGSCPIPGKFSVLLLYT